MLAVWCAYHDMILLMIINSMCVGLNIYSAQGLRKQMALERDR